MLAKDKKKIKEAICLITDANDRIYDIKSISLTPDELELLSSTEIVLRAAANHLARLVTK